MFLGYTDPNQNKAQKRSGTSLERPANSQNIKVLVHNDLIHMQVEFYINYWLKIKRHWHESNRNV